MSNLSAQKDGLASPKRSFPVQTRFYAYILFRGSDVKDLRIEEAPKENRPPPPQELNDPAILGVSASNQPYTYDELFRMLIHSPFRERKNSCGYFRCLPSDCFDAPIP